jgi:DNA modification methylase
VKPYYQDEAVTIYHGDCREILPTLEADHLITDPPYSAHVHSKQWISAALKEKGGKRTSTAHRELGFDSLSDEVRDLISKEAARAIARWSIAFCDIESLHLWRDSMIGAQLDYVRTCVWHKRDSAPQFTGDRPASSCEAFVCSHRPGKKRWNGGGRRNFFDFPINADRGANPHPSTKPIELMTAILSLFTDPSETVLDPFMGSGTTLRAAKDLGRKAIGIELNERYCEIAARRMGQEVLAL